VFFIKHSAYETSSVTCVNSTFVLLPVSLVNNHFNMRLCNDIRTDCGGTTKYITGAIIDIIGHTGPTRPTGLTSANHTRHKQIVFFRKKYYITSTVKCKHNSRDVNESRDSKKFLGIEQCFSRLSRIYNCAMSVSRTGHCWARDDSRLATGLKRRVHARDGSAL